MRRLEYSMEITLKNIWAKTAPFQSIETHSILAGITAQTIWDRMLPPGVQIQLEQLLSCERIQVRAWLGYLVSLHDLGKVEENFQYQWPEMKQRMDEAGLKPAFLREKSGTKKQQQCLSGIVSGQIQKKQSVCFGFMREF